MAQYLLHRLENCAFLPFTARRVQLRDRRQRQRQYDQLEFETKQK